jgi:hypothetical protein
MAKYPFLSDQWVAEARRIYAEVQAEGGLPPASVLVPVRVNLVVSDAPFGSGALQAHVDTTEGRVVVEVGHVEKPDVTISLDYTTARALFVGGDPQAVMQAFLGGRLRIDGDMAKLLDPRSGMWPAAGGGGATPTWAAPRAANGQAGSPDGAPELGFPHAPALKAAARLQEITE